MAGSTASAPMTSRDTAVAVKLRLVPSVIRVLPCGKKLRTCTCSMKGLSAMFICDVALYGFVDAAWQAALWLTCVAPTTAPTTKPAARSETMAVHTWCLLNASLNCSVIGTMGCVSSASSVLARFVGLALSGVDADAELRGTPSEINGSDDVRGAVAAFSSSPSPDTVRRTPLSLICGEASVGRASAAPSRFVGVASAPAALPYPGFWRCWRRRRWRGGGVRSTLAAAMPR
mmetsp:Transcript_1507/g.4758  ORF Transcript_1507/g.4758 Transcript_1507/m.4758 type:complete len:231 (+) Transcript_1507:1127-1819(+)